MLNLENPHEYYGQIDNYVMGHSELLVWIRHMTLPGFYLNFRHVLGFSGMVRWAGAALRIGSDEEFLQFVHQIAPQLEKSDTELLNQDYYGRLYIFEGKSGVAAFQLIATDYHTVEHLQQKSPP